MTPTFLESVIRGAEALAARDPVGTLPDPDLLRRFAADRDEAAFAVLLRRHGPLVWGVCRILLPADADAEDAFQATFLALVRSAGSVRKAEALGGWLHGVAYRVAMKARRAAARRRQRELTAAVPETDSPVADAAWDELQAAVHAEVCRLPEKLRLPFVLCGLQGRQQADAAQQLGWKVGTLSARLSQARQRLLDRLARRGVPVGVAAGAAVLGAAGGSAAVPSSLCLKTLAAARDPAAASDVVLSLARGVSYMTATRTKLLAVAVLAAGVLTTGVGTQLLSTADAQPPGREIEADHVKRALEYLRKPPAAAHWEYKFIPMNKPLRIADLQAVLRTAELEGWEYCGSQDIASADDQPRALPHLAFKRRRDDRAAVPGDPAARLATLAALAAAHDKAAREAAAQEAVARRAVDEAVLASRLHADQLKAAEAALAQERDRATRLELLLKDDRAKHDAFLKKMRDLEKAKAADPRAPATTVSLPLRYVLAQDVAKVLEAASLGSLKATPEARTNSLLLQGPPDLLAKVKEAVETMLDVPAAGSAKSGESNQPVTVRFRLHNVDGKTAAARLGETMPGARIVAEVHPDSIVLKGPPHVLDVARKLFQTTIDVKPADLTAKGPAIELAVIPLKRANPKDVLDLLPEVFRNANVAYKAEIHGNALIVAGPPEAVLNIRKVAESLDQKAK